MERKLGHANFRSSLARALCIRDKAMMWTCHDTRSAGFVLRRRNQTAHTAYLPLWPMSATYRKLMTCEPTPGQTRVQTSSRRGWQRKNDSCRMLGASERCGINSAPRSSWSAGFQTRNVSQLRHVRPCASTAPEPTRGASTCREATPN